VIDAVLLVALDAPAGITQVAEGPLPTATPELSKTWKVTAEEAVPPVILAWKTVRVTVRETKNKALASLVVPLPPVASNTSPLPIQTALRMPGLFAE
jgi:hypothetical protein